jgi:hypothetical protein
MSVIVSLLIEKTITYAIIITRYRLEIKLLKWGLSLLVRIQPLTKLHALLYSP